MTHGPSPDRPAATLEELARLLIEAAAVAPDRAAEAAAEARNGALTKPPGALGRLERIAVWTAGWRGDPQPRADRAQILVFAGEHGVAGRGVSAYPPEVTGQMVANFEAGGAAINQLAALSGATLTVRALELGRPTGDLSLGPAMDADALLDAVGAGWAAVDPDADVIALGEMGIGGTTAASAVAAALFGGEAAEWVGAGTGVSGARLEAKIAAVAAGAARCAGASPLEILAELGGRELAAIAGATLRARGLRIPVLLDGFICTAAVAPLAVAAPGALDHCLAAHRSAEGPHGRLLQALGLDPLLDLGLRLGEGSGAATALLILKAALACHNGMASFAQAGVSGAAAP